MLEMSHITVMWHVRGTSKTSQAPSVCRAGQSGGRCTVGRPNPPYTFYWRRITRYDEPGTPDPWESSDLDLSTDHVIPSCSKATSISPGR